MNESFEKAITVPGVSKVDFYSSNTKIAYNVHLLDRLWHVQLGRVIQLGWLMYDLICIIMLYDPILKKQAGYTFKWRPFKSRYWTS